MSSNPSTKIPLDISVLSPAISLGTDNSEDQISEPTNHGPFPKFSDLLHDILMPIWQVKKDPTELQTLSSRKHEIIEKFIRNYRWTVGDNIYPVARLLLPEKDNRLYHAKESKLGDLIISIYKIPPNSSDYVKIKKWKRSAENRFGRGDHGFAEICCEAIKFRGGVDVEGSSITVTEVNQFLDDFGKNTDERPNSELSDSALIDGKNYQRNLLSSVLMKMNIDEIRYLIKIMMRLKLLKGMENNFLNVWHPDAPRLLDLVNDLRRVLYQLHSSRISLDPSEASIRVHYPFKPQLASRTNLNYEEIAQVFKGDFFLEEKLDGERMQLHMDDYGESFQYFSRKATNYTSLYGLNFHSGSFSKFISGCFPKSVKSIILDGEMVVFDHLRKQMLPFGFLKGSALSTISDSNENVRPMFIAYDLLYLNGRSFENASLLIRREALKKLLIPIENVIEIVKHYRVSQAAEIEKALRKAIEINSEGVIIKNPLSRYSIAERNKQWIKVKPEYLDEFGDDVDLTIIGRTRQNKTSYMCGLRVDLESEEILKPHFVSFCSIANGISIDDYSAIEKLCYGKWKDINKKPPPKSLVEFGSRLPEEWIDPTDSAVIQVKARSIDIGQGGMSYKAGTTLYNAYFKEMRPDKDWTTCLSISEYKEIKSVRSRKQKLNDKPLDLTKRKKRKLTKKQILEKELRTSSLVELKSQIFDIENLSFIVLSDMITAKERVSQDDVIRAIKQNGGKVIRDVKSDQESKLMILSDKNSLKTQLLHNQGYDIIKPQWIFDCIALEKLVFIEPDHCLLVSDKLFDEALTRVDEYGDSFQIPAEMDLSRYISRLEFPKKISLSQEPNAEMFTNEIFYLFKDQTFYVAKHDFLVDTDFALLKLRSMILMFHGNITDSKDLATYVIIPAYDKLLEGYISCEEKRKFQSWREREVAKMRSYLANTVNIEGGKLLKISRIVDDSWVESRIQKL